MNPDVSAIASRTDKEVRPIVRFFRQPVENIAATKLAGTKQYSDVDFVHVTPAWSKDKFVQDAKEWLDARAMDAQNDRIPPHWVERWRQEYEAWKNGQELPLQGTPVKGWGLLTPAEQQTLIDMGCRTVEELAKMNDEGVRRCGPMGIGLKWKNLAIAWCAQMTDMGGLATQMEGLQSENTLLKANLEAMHKTMTELQAEIRSRPVTAAPPLTMPPAMTPAPEIQLGG